MSTYSPAVSKRPSISLRLRPLSMTCVSPRERGLPSRVGTSRNECSGESCIDVLQLLVGSRLDVAVERSAVRVDSDGERAEVLHAELPEALGHELLPCDLFDLLDLGRLERSRAADDREVDHPERVHRLDRLVREAALPTDRANAILRAEPLREAHHPRARGRADAELLVLPFALGICADLAHVRRRVQEERAREIHRRLDPLVEDPDLRPIADPDDVTLDDHLVPGAELQDLGRVRYGERDFVRRHYASRSYSTRPSALTCAEARRAAQHW